VNGASSGGEGGDGRSGSDQLASGLDRPAIGQIGAASPGQDAARSASAPQASTEFPPLARPGVEPAASPGQPEQCHFLRTVGSDNKLGPPLKDAALTHRCAAFGEPLPLSLRQQELVCLQRVYVSCPRYLRGALMATEEKPRPEVRRSSGRVSGVTATGVLLMVAALGLGAALMSGILPGLTGSPSQVPVAVVTESPSVEETPSASPSGEESPTASPSPSATPSPTPTPTPEPWPTCPAGPDADRYVCLKPCPDESACYVYLIRDVRETVKNLASYFGVTVAAIRQMNPWLGATGEPSPGQTLRLPPPTKP
jgi:hypothetical protein